MGKRRSNAGGAASVFSHSRPSDVLFRVYHSAHVPVLNDIMVTTLCAIVGLSSICGPLYRKFDLQRLSYKKASVPITFKVDECDIDFAPLPVERCSAPKLRKTQNSRLGETYYRLLCSPGDSIEFYGRISSRVE